MTMAARVASAVLASALVPAGAHATALPSVACAFTEPFINVDVWPGGARIVTPAGTRTARRVTLGGDRHTPRLAMMVANWRLTLVVRDQPGSDGMSDFVSPQTGELSGYASRQVLTGACVRYPDGTTPRPVIAASPVRARSSGTSRSVGALAAHGRFWAFPEATVNGWARGAFAQRPASGSGRITVEFGWVPARRLGLPSAH